MRKLWSLDIDGRPHEVDVTWDVTMTGAGRVVVDGELVDCWNIGVKWPGTTRVFSVTGRNAEVTQGVLNFDLTVEGVEVPLGLPRAHPFLTRALPTPSRRGVRLHLDPVMSVA